MCSYIKYCQVYKIPKHPWVPGTLILGPWSMGSLFLPTGFFLAHFWFLQHILSFFLIDTGRIWNRLLLKDECEESKYNFQCFRNTKCYILLFIYTPFLITDVLVAKINIIAIRYQGNTMMQKLVTNSRQLAQVRTTMTTEHANKTSPQLLNDFTFQEEI